MQEILSSQGKVNLNSVHKLQQQSLIVLLLLTQTHCSIFYPCNNMLHRFMHADAQAAHLTLHPAPWSPLLLPGPHKHPMGRQAQGSREWRPAGGFCYQKDQFLFTHTNYPCKKSHWQITPACLLSFQKHLRFLCVCAVCVCRPTQPFAARCNIALRQLPPTTGHEPAPIWRHALLAHRLYGAAKQQLPLTGWKGKIWDQKPNLHCLNILLSPNLILNGSDQSALSTKAAKSCKTSGFVLKRTRQGTANFTSYGTARQLQ